MRFLRLFSRDRETPAPPVEAAAVAPRTYTDERGYTWADTDYFGFGDFSPAKDQLELNYPDAEAFLKRHGNEFPWGAVWLEHGRPRPAPSRELCLSIDAAGGHIPGNCYNNALRLALGMAGKIVLPQPSKQILYGEGVAVHPTGMCLHAWLVIDEEIYDPTWPDAYRATYFGIAVDPAWMLNFAETVGKVSLLQNWHATETRLPSLFAATR